MKYAEQARKLYRNYEQVAWNKFRSASRNREPDAMAYQFTVQLFQTPTPDSTLTIEGSRTIGPFAHVLAGQRRIEVGIETDSGDSEQVSLRISQGLVGAVRRIFGRDIAVSTRIQQSGEEPQEQTNNIAALARAQAMLRRIRGRN